MDEQTKSERLEKGYPIAEIFDSIQGEGEHAGRRMVFIRFAGCPVGKTRKDDEIRTTCTTINGFEFKCDTDYRRAMVKTIEELLKEVPKDCDHVCLTGGEPFVHNLLPLCVALINANKVVHIETSGTVKPKYFSELLEVGLGNVLLWITCSPKEGCLEEMIDNADEIKLLVHSKYDTDTIPEAVMRHQNVFIQPINEVYVLNQGSLKRAIEIVMQFPQFRLSSQLHKIWSIR